jgi:hypothetical protein
MFLRETSGSRMLNKLSALLLMLIVVQPLQAGTISGTISDEGEPLAGVEVTLIDAGSNVVVNQARTTSSGSYRITVKPRTYNIRASLHEYADEWVRDIRVGAGTVQVNITMTPRVFVDSKDVPESDGCD